MFIKKLITFLTPVCVFVACQMFDNEPKDPKPGEAVEALAEMRDVYCGFAEKKVTEKGYAVGKCDGLLFTSLHSVGCGYPGVDAFEGNPGQWFRSPDHDCLESGGANSTISKDMIAGLLLHIAFTKDGDMARRLLTYCKDRPVAGGIGCRIGDSDGSPDGLSKIILPPTTIQILEDMVDKYVHGYSVSHATEASKVIINTGFQAHLQVIMELVKCLVYGGISDRGLEILRRQAEREPNNALFQAAYHLYADGDMTRVHELISEHYSIDRLPTNQRDQCTDYRYQRDESSTNSSGGRNWDPCPERPAETFDGTDLIFAATVAIGGLHDSN